MIIRLASTPSTMIEAARLAREGAAHGTWVVADEQTAGQGRHGRSWQSPSGGLYATGILRPKHVSPILTLAIGLAAAQAVTEVSGIVPDLRWPNDLMIGDCKLGGILTVTEDQAVLAGVGINLGNTDYPGAAALSGVSRDELLHRLITHVEHHINLSIHDVLRLFAQASSYVSNRRVNVENHGDGVTAGLTEDGFLLLRKDDGTMATIVAGGVRPA